MKVERATKSDAESMLQSRAREALLKALPWLEGHDTQAEVTFNIRFGHKVSRSDGRELESILGRTDLLVQVDGQPVIVLELKRTGLGITEDDVEQGLSYARVLHPRPPLVIATDGEQTRFVETSTGAEWAPVERDGQALKALLGNAALVAADDMKRAVARLVGKSPAMWIDAARAVTEDFIAERTGDWTMPDLPFVDDFLLSRDVVGDTIASLQAGERLVMLEGDPLMGKSSAIRELADRLAADADFAVMTLDADCGLDLFTALADIWSGRFSWPLTPFEARHWLQQLSRIAEPALVLVIDDFDGRRSGFRRDLEALTSNLYGDRVRIVLALDRGAAARLSTASNGRTASALKRRGARSKTIGPLNDGEFAAARAVLNQLQIDFLPGAQHSTELRLPWVLRDMCSGLITTRPPNAGVGMLPSVPGMALLQGVREGAWFSGVSAGYRKIAHALIDDIQAGGQSTEFRLESLQSYVIRREPLRARLAADEIHELVSTGLLREGRSAGGEEIFIAQLPTALASELASALGQHIDNSEDGDALARLLTQVAASVPLGSAVAAMAIVDAASARGSLHFTLLQRLLERVPRTEALPPGTQFAMLLPNGQHLELVIQADELEIRSAAGTRTVPLDHDFGSAIADLEPWTILSHLATRRMAADRKDGSESARFDLHLLVTLGSYPGVLLDVSGRSEPLGLEMHDLPDGGEMVCSEAGIVEPITYAIYLRFLSEPELAPDLVDAALEKRSLALLMRMHTALRALSKWFDSLHNLDRDMVVPAITALTDGKRSSDQTVD